MSVLYTEDQNQDDENGGMYSEEGTLTLDWMTSSRGAGLGTVL